MENYINIKPCMFNCFQVSITYLISPPDIKLQFDTAMFWSNCYQVSIPYFISPAVVRFYGYFEGKFVMKNYINIEPSVSNCFQVYSTYIICPPVIQLYIKMFQFNCYQASIPYLISPQFNRQLESNLVIKNDMNTEPCVSDCFQVQRTYIMSTCYRVIGVNNHILVQLLPSGHYLIS